MHQNISNNTNQNTKQEAQRQHAMHEMATQGHSRSFVVVPIDVAYMTAY